MNNTQQNGVQFSREVRTYVPISEMAKFLGKTEQTLKKWCAGDIVPHRKLGRGVYQIDITALTQSSIQNLE